MKYLCVFIFFGVLFFSCNKSDDPSPAVNMMDDPELPLPINSEVIGMGTFISYAHNLKGNVSLHVDSAGIKTLRFENYTMTQGPDVHVYISKSSNYTKNNVIEVTKLNEGFNNSSVNFNFTSSAYTSEYKFVLVYCVQYNSLFGYTELI